MDTLVAGPWLGSLHGELLCWQGYLRAQSRRFKRTIVVADPDKRAIYADFASAVVTEPPHLPNATWIRPADVPVQWIGHQPLVLGQEFTVLGNYTEEVAYHLAIDAQDSSQFGRKDWAKVVHNLSTDLDIAWMSDGLSTCHSIGGTDLRNASFDKLLKAVTQAKIVIGPSGGIVALASLCNQPYITWVPADVPNLYPDKWNPHNAPGVVFRGHPSLQQLESAIGRVMEIYSSAPDMEPAY